MSVFNLNDLLNQRSKEMAAEENKKPEDRGSFFVDVRELVPSKDNFYHVDTELKQSIEIFGVMQPLLVQKKEDGYHVIAGHRRRLAVMELVNEGKEQFAKVPVVLYESESETLDQLALIVANRFREKTDWEKMTETIETEKLVQKIKEEMKIAGKTREMVAQILDTSSSTLAKYKAIAKNLSDDLMNAFKDQKINISVAYETSSLDSEQQVLAYNILKDNDGLSMQDIKNIKNPMTYESEEKAENTEVKEETKEISGVSESNTSESTDTAVKESGNEKNVFKDTDASGDINTSGSTEEILQTGNPTEADYALEEAERIFREGNSPDYENTSGIKAAKPAETEEHEESGNTYQVLVHLEKSIKAVTQIEAEEKVKKALTDAGYKVTDITAVEA